MLVCLSTALSIPSFLIRRGGEFVVSVMRDIFLLHHLITSLFLAPIAIMDWLDECIVTEYGRAPDVLVEFLWTTSRKSKGRFKTSVCTE